MIYILNEPFLSVIVTSYNRAEITKMTVESILKYEGSDLDCVVVDNHSDDNTVELLSEINDPRLKIHVNDHNIGHNANLLECWKYADGEYAFLLLSREVMHSDKVPNLINFLNEHKPNFMYCAYDKSDESKTKFFKSGEEAFNHFAYQTLHPSGYTFKTELIKKFLENKDTSKAYENFGYLPLDFAAAEITYGGGVI